MRQLAAIFHGERQGLIEASTKTGKTAGCLWWLTERALDGLDGHNFWWVAPSNKQARMAFSRLKGGGRGQSTPRTKRISL